MIEAKIFITLKKTVADPQGLTIMHALKSLGFNKVSDVRIGKLVTLKLKENKNDPKKEIDEMCIKLLANPVIEDYLFVLVDGNRNILPAPNTVVDLRISSFQYNLGRILDCNFPHYSEYKLREFDLKLRQAGFIVDNNL